MNTVSFVAASSGTASLKRALAYGVAMSALLMGSAAYAQDQEVETVTVTGYRASLAGALSTKRASAEMVDAINAEDIAAFPDANLAESLQRLPGVAVDRDNGEGRTITVRGLNADFTRVTLNGLEALSTAGASASGDDPNRSRQFDFNTFASELFTNLKVYKSSAAETDEGSLGATVELQTGHPFDTGDKAVLSVQNAWYEYGKPFNPRVAAVVSHNFFGGRLGFLGSVAYNMRHQTIDSYQNSQATSSYVYRNATFKGSSSAWRYGFADPYSSTDTSHCNVSSATGTVPLTKVAYLQYCKALQGSNATAYGAVEGTGTASTASPSMATTLMPTSASLYHQDLYQTRLGTTGSVQWQADENTLVTVDAVMSSTYQNSTNNVLSANGLNRFNTSSSLNKLSATGTTSADATNLYSYTANTGAFVDLAKCNNASVAGYAPVTCLNTGTTQNFAHNTDPYTYYSKNGTNLAAAEAMLIKFVGRPSTQIASAHVSAPAAGSLTTGLTTGVIDQMTLANVDYATRTDEANYTTQFMQGSFNVDHSFSEHLRTKLELGMSVSRNHQVGYLVEFNKLDSGTYDGTTCTNCYVYDATAEDESMPYMNFGFDPTQSSNWDLYKGYTYFKHYMTNTTNKFRSAKASAAYDVTDQFTIKAGFSARIYDFATTKYSRVMKDQYGMPSIGELQDKYGSTFSIADLGKVVSWGKGLNAPSGMNVSGFFAPDLDKFKQYLHVDCNCVDSDFGDMTISNLFSAASTSVTGNTYTVHEHDKSGYVQADFKEIFIFGNELRGNVGVRVATTSLDTIGHGTVGNAIAGKNYYANVLPSANLAYSLTDEMLIRASASKAIARPQLATLAPSITSFTIDTTGNDGNGLTIGNPKLKPYNAKTVDLGYEWYFSQGAVFAVTGFAKWIKDVPQQVTTAGYLDQYMDKDSFNQLYAVYTSVPGMISTTNAAAILNSYNEVPGNRFTATMYKNARGGVLNGLEITYQQVLNFLPAPFDGFGINANYTLIHSRMHYIINPESKVGAGDEVDGDAAWTGASPIAFNATVFYDGKDWANRSWSGRVSLAYRSKYIAQYPITGGDASPGTTNNPIMNDAIYSKSTLNVDTSFTYDYTDYMQFRVDALNLTNQTDNRYAYTGLPTVTKYAATGRQVFAGVRFKF